MDFFFFQSFRKQTPDVVYYSYSKIKAIQNIYRPSPAAKCPTVFHVRQQWCRIDLQYQYIQTETCVFFLDKAAISVLQKSTCDPSSAVRGSHPGLPLLNLWLSSLKDKQSTFTQLHFLLKKQHKNVHICTQSFLLPWRLNYPSPRQTQLSPIRHFLCSVLKPD